MEPQGSLPQSQVPATCPYSDQVSTLHLTSWRSFLILYSLLCLGILSGLFPSGFPTTNSKYFKTTSLCKVFGFSIL